MPPDGAASLVSGDVRRHNLTLVLEHLVRAGPSARSEISDATGLTRGSVTALAQVLVDDDAAAGKDLGILNIATNLPQALSTALAGVLIASLGYPAIFVAGIVAVILGGIALIPIKSVR